MMKGKPKRDGSGMGTRANRGRGGCFEPLDNGLKQIQEHLRKGIEEARERWEKFWDGLR